MKTAWLDSAVNGPNPLRWLFLALAAAWLTAGCATPVDPAHVVDTRYRPSNIYVKNKILDPLVKRVAVLPMTTVSATETAVAGAGLLQPLLDAELEKSKRFELYVVSPQQLRQWTGQESWRVDEVLPPDFFTRLHDACGCDAVFFTQLTRFHPYQPVAVGWKMCLVQNVGNEKLWEADEVFDAGDSEVANAAWHYSAQHVHIEGPAADPASILGSPSRFGQYTLSALMATLPER